LPGNSPRSVRSGRMTAARPRSAESEKPGVPAIPRPTQKQHKSGRRRRSTHR
jgi:hypothetical protein